MLANRLHDPEPSADWPCKLLSSLAARETPVKLATLSKKEAETFPEGAIWNAFVDLLAMSDELEFAPSQVSAFHAFWYDSEVQNGGHLQYFLNRGVEEAERAVGSLRSMGALAHSELLSDAVAAWHSQTRSSPETVQEYVEEALKGDFNIFDDRFHEIAPSLFDYLQGHLSAHQPQFVIVTS